MIFWFKVDEICGNNRTKTAIQIFDFLPPEKCPKLIFGFFEKNYVTNLTAISKNHILTFRPKFQKSSQQTVQIYIKIVWYEYGIYRPASYLQKRAVVFPF